MIYKLLYKLFGVFRYKVITERGLRCVVDVRAIHNEYESDLTDLEINELQFKIDEEKKEETLLMNKVNEFQRLIEIETSSQLLELINLRNELYPEEIEANADLKNHFEDIRKEKPKEMDKRLDKVNEDKRIRKLFMKLAKIYHPDKAPAGKEQEYTEIFKIITAYRNKQDYEGLKSFSKSLNKPNKRDLKSLLKLKFKLLSDLMKIKRDKEEFEQSRVYAEYCLYLQNPKQYIDNRKSEIQVSIIELKKRKNGIYF